MSVEIQSLSSESNENIGSSSDENNLNTNNIDINELTDDVNDNKEEVIEKKQKPLVQSFGTVKVKSNVKSKHTALIRTKSQNTTKSKIKSSTSKSSLNDEKKTKIERLPSDVDKKLKIIEDLESSSESEEKSYTDDLSKIPDPVYKPKKIRKVGAASRISTNSLNFTVQLMDSKSLRIKVNDDFKIKEIIDIVAHKLKMYQYETFGLGRLYKDEIQWLDPSKTVSQCTLTEKDILTFRVKYFKNYLKHVDPVSIALYYEQIRSEIMSGRYVCSEKLCIKLMALQMQIICGDFNRGTHKKSFIIDNFMDDFIPPKYQSLSSDKLAYFEEKIFFNYRKLKGTNKTVAMKRYITLAKEIKTYGTNWFLLDRDKDEKYVGVCETGFFVQIKANPLKFNYYPFKDVKYELDDVQLKIVTKEKETYVFKMYKNYFRDIKMFIDAYTYILKKQGYKEYEHLDIEKVIDCPPYWKLERPINRVLNKEESKKNKKALELLRENYLRLCTQNNEKAIPRFLLQIDEMLEQEKNLKQLDLRRSKLRDSDLDTIIQAVDVTLRTVGDTDDTFKPESLLINYNELKSGKSIGKLCLILDIKEIDLSSNFIDDKGAKDLASYIKECHNLKKFTIDDNHIFNTGALKLLKALKKCPKISAISFNNCGIRNDLTDSIEKVCKTIGSLVFDSKKLNSISFQDNVLTDVGLKTMLSQIESITRLKNINFVNVHLSRESCVQMTNWLLKLMSTRNQLESLKLSYNFFLPQSLEDLATLIDSPNLVLKELEIGSLNIPKELMSKILISLEKNDTIESLVLSGNPIDKKIVDQLGALISNNRRIKKLGLRNCDIERKGFECIAASLNNNSVIEEIDLAGNDLGAIKAAEAFGKMLIANKTLKKLNIAACQIINESFKILIKAFSHNESLEILHLDGNRLKGETLMLLGKSISKNKNLRILSLQDININHKDILPFISELNDSQSLEVVDMRNNIKKNLEQLNNRKLQHKFALLL